MPNLNNAGLQYQGNFIKHVIDRPTADIRTRNRTAKICRFADRIGSLLADVEFENTWSGAVDMSLGQTLSVGRMGKHQNIFYAIGFSDHGVNLTSIFGRIIADLHAGKLADWQWLPCQMSPALHTERTVALDGGSSCSRILPGHRPQNSLNISTPVPTPKLTTGNFPGIPHLFSRTQS
jgi:hypothetical protein